MNLLPRKSSVSFTRSFPDNMEIGIVQPAAPRPTQEERSKQSLFKRCNMLLAMLIGVPKIEDYVRKILEVKTDTDPVQLLWAILRQGAALIDTINYLRPGHIQDYWVIGKDEQVTEATFTCPQARRNTKLFLDACRDDLYMTDDELFNHADLYKEDTNCLVRAMNLLEKLLKRIETVKNVCFLRGTGDLLTITVPRLSSASSLDTDISRKMSIDPQDALSKPTTNRDKVLKELLDTEINYVSDLEKLHDYKTACTDQEILRPDEIKTLFSNLDELVDFQRKFQDSMEKYYRTDSYHPNLLELFQKFETGFAVYDVFCPNNKVAAAFLEQKGSNLIKLESILEPYHEVNSYMIKPIQRICKYPLLIKELIKNSPPDDEHLPALSKLQDLVKVIAERVNEKQRSVETKMEADDIISRVEDWKGFDPDFLQNIVLVDKLTITIKDQERDLFILLFENIIILCRESTDKKKREKPAIVIKGKVLMSNVTGVVNNSSDFTVKVFWKSTEIESFRIKFRTKDQMAVWAKALDERMKVARSMIPRTKPKRILGKGGKRAPRLSMASVDTGADASASPEKEIPSIPSTPSFATLAGEHSPRRLSIADSTGVGFGESSSSQKSSTVDLPLSQDRSRRGSIIRYQPQTPRTHEDEDLVMKELGKLSQELHDFIAIQEREKQTKQECETCIRNKYFAKVHYDVDIFLVSFDKIPTFDEFKVKILKKVVMAFDPAANFDDFDQESMGLFLFKCRDEDGDMITLSVNEDIEIAFCSSTSPKIHIFLSLLESADAEKASLSEVSEE